MSFAQRPLDSRPMNTMNLVQETATWETEVLLAQGLGLECTMQVRKGCTKQRLSCLSSDPKHSSSEIHIVKRKQEKNLLMKVSWTSDVLPTVESTKKNLFDTSSPHTGWHLGRSRDHRSAFTEEKSVDSRSVEVLSYASMARKSVFAKLAVADRSASTASKNIDARNALAPPYAVMVEKNCYASNEMARRSAIMVSEKSMQNLRVLVHMHPWRAEMFMSRMWWLTGRSSIAAQLVEAHLPVRRAKTASLTGLW